MLLALFVEGYVPHTDLFTIATLQTQQHASSTATRRATFAPFALPNGVWPSPRCTLDGQAEHLALPPTPPSCKYIQVNAKGAQRSGQPVRQPGCTANHAQASAREGNHQRIACSIACQRGTQQGDKLLVLCALLQPCKRCHLLVRGSLPDVRCNEGLTCRLAAVYIQLTGSILQPDLGDGGPPKVPHAHVQRPMMRTAAMRSQ